VNQLVFAMYTEFIISKVGDEFCILIRLSSVFSGLILFYFNINTTTNNNNIGQCTNINFSRCYLYIVSVFFFDSYFVNSLRVLETFLCFTLLRPAPLHFAAVCQKTLSIISPSL
jgi:hypothetical protein